MPASVKGKDLSGEIGWRLDELEDKFCDFLRLAQTVGGNLFPEGVHFLGGEAVVHGSINNTAGDGVDLDITGSQLLGQCFGEAVLPPASPTRCSVTTAQSSRATTTP